MNQKGATLIELILSIIIISIVVYVVTDAFVYSSKSILTGNSARDATQSGRLAIDRMVREIRDVRDNKCVGAATGTSFSFMDAGNNAVAFTWAGAGAPLMRNGDVLVDHVSNLTLKYFDSADPPNDITATPPTVCAAPNTCLSTCASTNIWSVSIDLITQSGTETMEFRSQVHPVSF